jgi:predicted O-linked N-acetylglucosamine transferase (SPINDLY family)
VLLRQNQPDEAAASFRRALALDPAAAGAHANLGTALQRQGRPDEAIASYGRALEIQPADAGVHCNLGSARRVAGDRAGAAESFARAVELKPQFLPALSGLAEVLLELGRPGEALARFQEALALAPQDPALHFGRADCLFALGRFGEAVQAYQHVLSLNEAIPQAWRGLGCVLLKQKAYAAAAAGLRRAVELEPGFGEAYHNLGEALFELGQIDAALDAFRKAAELLRPNQPSLEVIATIIPGSPRADHQAVLDARRRWAAHLPAEKAVLRPQPGGRPLRVGYLSAFFQHRNWMKPVWGLVNHHDRDRFEVHLFSDAPSSAVSHGYRPDPRDRFHDITGLSNEAAARLIADQGIDLLVDLNAYSRPARLALLTRKPAPVVVAWFNTFATSGMDCFDYLIGDAHVIPPGEERYYTERVLRVPGCYLTFEVAYAVPDVGPAPCEAWGAVTFGCLAPQYKITPEVVEAWAQILHGSRGSRLVLKNTVLGLPDHRRFVHEQFGRLGIPPERVDLEGPAEHYDFLGKYAEVDIALDTFPYNGGTTTMEAIWQGVPVLTFHGDRWAGRISASLMHNAGLSEFVEPDLDGYVRQAVGWANAPDTPGKLQELRRTMRERLAAAPVCDVRGFARAMEEEYLGIWEARREGPAA